MSAWPPARGFASSSTKRDLSFKEEPRRRRHPTSLSAFLPPSGGGGSKSGLGELASTVLTFVGVAAFFLSPLGGLFFALFNSLFALAILLPIGGIVAFNVWQYFNTTTGPCPNCAAPVKAFKDESPSVCFNCGSIVQSKDGQIYIANVNNNNGMMDEPENVFATWMDGLSGVRRTNAAFDDDARRPDAPTKKSRSTTTTIIDVDVTRDDD